MNLIKKYKSQGFLVHFLSNVKADDIFSVLKKNGSNLKPEDISSITTNLKETMDRIGHLESENDTLFYFSPDTESCKRAIKNYPEIVTIELPTDISLSESIINKLWIS